MIFQRVQVAGDKGHIAALDGREAVALLALIDGHHARSDKHLVNRRAYDVRDQADRE